MKSPEKISNKKSDVNEEFHRQFSRVRILSHSEDTGPTDYSGSTQDGDVYKSDDFTVEDYG